VEYVIDLSRDVNEFGDIVMIELKFLSGEKMLYIPDVAGEQIVHTDHVIALAKETIAKMRAKKTCCTCY
jgi:hypothetical protein